MTSRTLLLRRLLGPVTAATLSLPFVALAAPVGGVPTSSLVEGFLTSTGGGAAADGVYSVKFSLYAASTGGSAVWTETTSVSVKGGLFSQVLGLQNPLNPAVIAPLAGSAWLGVQIATDPELERRPLHAVTYATRAATAASVDCSGCIGASQLDPKAMAPFAKTADLAKIAVSGAYGDLTGAPDLSGFTKSSALAKVATSGNYSDLTGGPDLSAYAKIASLADVAKTGSYADLKNLPVLAKVGAACGTGLVAKGIKGDGSLECVAGFDPAALPADALNEVSNGLLTNQFTDTVAGKSGVPIPDNNPTGVSDIMDFPDLGIAQKITVSVDVSNSDTTALAISVFDPNNVEYVLYDKNGPGVGVKTSWPSPTPTLKGDLNTWVGKNINGKWYLKVVDTKFLNNTTDGKINAWSITINTLSSKKVDVNGNLNVAGASTFAGPSSFAGAVQLPVDVLVGGTGVASNFSHVMINYDHRNGTSNGWQDIPKRTLVINKLRAKSILRIMYQDTLGTLGTSYAQCHWRILVDGQQVAYFSAADLTAPNAWRMQNATHTALAVGFAAGAHTIKVQNSNNGAGECLMGWNTSNNFLASEEVGQ